MCRNDDDQNELQNQNIDDAHKQANCWRGLAQSAERREGDKQSARDGVRRRVLNQRKGLRKTLGSMKKTGGQGTPKQGFNAEA